MCEFYSLYADSLAAVCSRYITDAEDRKDVMQDALVSIVSHIGDFEYRGEGSLRAWATRVVVNQALMHLKQTRRHELLRQDMADEPEEDDPPLSDIPPEAIHEMVRQLPTGYRTVFNLYVFEGRSHQEIARLLGISESTSASQLYRAKNQLARMIKAYQTHKQPR